MTSTLAQHWVGGRYAARLGIGVTIVLVLLIHTMGRIGAFCAPYRADSYFYASLGYCVARGDVLYRDVWCDKPPCLMFLYGAAYRLAGPAYSRHPLIPVETAGMLLGYFIVYLLARELYGRLAACFVTLTATLAINYFSVFDYTTEGFALAENYIVATSTAAVFCYVRGYRRSAPLWFLAAGVALGVTGMLKQTVVAVAGTIAVHAILLAIARRQKDWWKYAGSLMSGVAFGIAPFALVCLLQGTARAAWRDIMEEGYPHLQLFSAFPYDWRDVFPLWVPLAWIPLGLIGWIELRRQGSEPVPGKRVESAGPSVTELLLILMWIVAEWTLIYYLPRRAYHFYVTGCVPVVMLAGLLWSSLVRLASLRPHLRDAAVAAGCLAASASLFASLPAVNALAPFAMRRWRSYDHTADEAALRQGVDDLKNFIPKSGKYFGKPPEP